jgi:methionine synthase II (cobalamin-independent)
VKFLPTSLRTRIAERMLRTTKSNARKKKGVNLRGAEQIILTYTETDERKFKLVKDIAIYLKKEYDIKRVMRFAYIQADEKAIPTWHMRKLESDFFCMSDLNWYEKPIKNVKAHMDEAYDILIHLDPDAEIALDFFVAGSKAKMKVANFSAHRADDFDILIPPQPKDSWKQRNHRIIEFIGDSPLT